MSNQIIDKALAWLAGDTDWKTLATGVKYRKRGGSVCIAIYGTYSLSTAWTTIGTLPTGYRPTQVVYFACTTITNNTNIIGAVDTDGKFIIRLPNGASGGSYSVEAVVSYIL